MNQEQVNNFGARGIPKTGENERVIVGWQRSLDGAGSTAVVVLEGRAGFWHRWSAMNGLYEPIPFADVHRWLQFCATTHPGTGLHHPLGEAARAAVEVAGDPDLVEQPCKDLLRQLAAELRFEVEHLPV